MEPLKPSTFTPFLRRFTDERARDITQLRALYAEVKALHEASPYSAPNAVYEIGYPIYARYSKRYPDEVLNPLSALLHAVTVLERPIFEFPEISWDVAHLTLKEQVDLERFLTAKQYFHAHEDRLIAELQDGLGQIFGVLTLGIPETLGPSPFNVPIMNALSEPKLLIDRLYNVVAADKSVNLGLFTELRERMYASLCQASNVIPHSQHKKPLKHAMDRDEPLAELASIYCAGTPFTAYLAASIPLRLTYEDRFRHMHVVGGSGAGKTQLLQNLILHDLQSPDPPALVIVDSQTDLIAKLSRLALFDPSGGRLADRLLLVTPRDIEYPPALNIFDVNRGRLDRYSETTKEQVTAGVIQTFDYLFGGLFGADLTAKQGVFFRFVARLMLALPETIGRTATILDLLALMDDPAPYRPAIYRLPPIQRSFFERDFASKTFVQTKEQIRYRLNAILENPTLARLFTSPETKIDLFDALNNNAIVLVDTAKDFLKGASSHFGRIFISLVLQAVLERAALPEHMRKPAFLIVDEAAAYFDSNIDDLLTEARKYKLGCVFAHQFLDQCTGALRSSLAANTSIKLASGVSMADARALAPDMRTSPDFILSQPQLQFAAHIRGATPEAVSIPVCPGALEAESAMPRASYELLLERNRTRVSLPAGVPQLAQSAPALAKTHGDQQEADPSRAASEW